MTLSSISPNLSKHWRFLPFWLSLCLVLFHCLVSIFVQRACNERAWLTSECSPRFDNFGTVRQAIAWYIQVKLTIFNQFSCLFSSCAFAKKLRNATHRTKIIISRWAFGSQPSAVIARMLNKNPVSWQTWNNRKLPKHKLSQNAKMFNVYSSLGL